MTTARQISARRTVQRIQGGVESASSDEGDDMHGGLINEMNVSMDFADADADPEGDGLMMGDDDDLGAFLPRSLCLLRLSPSVFEFLRLQ
jgi:hypothetical protein